MTGSLRVHQDCQTGSSQCRMKCLTHDRRCDSIYPSWISDRKSSSVPHFKFASCAILSLPLIVLRRVSDLPEIIQIFQRVSLTKLQKRRLTRLENLGHNRIEIVARYALVYEAESVAASSPSTNWSRSFPLTKKSKFSFTIATTSCCNSPKSF